MQNTKLYHEIRLAVGKRYDVDPNVHWTVNLTEKVLERFRDELAESSNRTAVVEDWLGKLPKPKKSRV